MRKTKAGIVSAILVCSMSSTVYAGTEGINEISNIEVGNEEQNIENNMQSTVTDDISDNESDLNSDAENNEQPTEADDTENSGQSDVTEDTDDTSDAEDNSTIEAEDEEQNTEISDTENNEQNNVSEEVTMTEPEDGKDTAEGSSEASAEANYEIVVIEGRKHLQNVEDGTFYTGVYTVEETGEEYYFDPNQGGAAAVGPANVNGKYFLYDENGVRYSGSGTPVINGNKYFVQYGVLKSGWLKLADWQMYFDPETYVAATGITHIDGKAYLFDKNGVEILKSRTEVVDGKKYWFQPDGSLMSGWAKLGDWQMYFDPETYVAATGVSEINGKYYIFDGNGVLRTGSGTPVIDGKKYWIKEDNTLGSGWLNLGVYKMYFNTETFEAVTGLNSIDGKRWLFDSNGMLYAKSGTPVVEGSKYWFTDDGSLGTGWLNMGSWKMYFDPETCKGATGICEVEGKKRLFDNNCLLIEGSGMFVVNGKKYCIDGQGNAYTGWYNAGTYKMYFDPNTGEAATGIKTIDGTKYLFDQNGVQINGNGTFMHGSKKYYMVNGVPMTGWQMVGPYKMYFDPITGEAATGVKVIDGKTYFFDSNGVISSGRQFINGKTYYYKSDGTLYRNEWVVFNGEKIYVDGNGVGLTDLSDQYSGAYSIKVDKGNCVVTVYKGGVPVRAMTCSVGLPGTETYSGTFHVGAKYRVKTLIGPSWGQYATAVSGQSGVYFHSVATTNANDVVHSVPVDQYNILGYPASHGCIRLCVRDAKWIYDNIPAGTPIYIGYFDNPLGKPATVKISSPVDPTDPNA